MNKESFNSDLERFELTMRRHLDEGIISIKKNLEEQEIRLRNDLNSAVGGFINYMRERYGSQV